VKLTLYLAERPPQVIYSYDAHYNKAENLMPHEPLDMPTEMPLPDPPWYKRIWLKIRDIIDAFLYEEF